MTSYPSNLGSGSRGFKGFGVLVLWAFGFKFLKKGFSVGLGFWGSSLGFRASGVEGFKQGLGFYMAAQFAMVFPSAGLHLCYTRV